MNVVRQTACLVVNPIAVNNFAALFNCMPTDQASDLEGSGLKTLNKLVGARCSFFAGPTGVKLFPPPTLIDT